MGLRENLSRFVPDKYKPPLVPSSYGEFVDTLRAQVASRVVAIPGRKTIFRTGSDLLGEDGANYEYNI